MTSLEKWNIYLKERSPLPALLFISGLGALSSLSFYGKFDLQIFLLGTIFNTLIFIQLRLGDEIKDFEKDKIVNPTRPLPRGLLQVREVSSVLVSLVGVIVAGGGIIALKYHWQGGAILILTTGFAWLMYKEFYAGAALSKEPMLYAITHQVIVFPLYAWVGFSFDPELIHSNQFLGWLLANFGGSFTYEICRKLNPNAHALAGTYAHHYGRPVTALLASVFILCIGLGSFYAGFGTWMILPLLILEGAILNWIKKPETYKIVEGITALPCLLVVLGPAILWLISKW